MMAVPPWLTADREIERLPNPTEQTDGFGRPEAGGRSTRTPLSSERTYTQLFARETTTDPGKERVAFLKLVVPTAALDVKPALRSARLGQESQFRGWFWLDSRLGVRAVDPPARFDPEALAVLSKAYAAACAFAFRIEIVDASLKHDIAQEILFHARRGLLDAHGLSLKAIAKVAARCAPVTPSQEAVVRASSNRIRDQIEDRFE